MSTKSKVPPLNGINDSSNDTPNNTTSSAAVATKEEEEEEDIYQALDELRVLTKYSIQNLTMFHRWYCTYVNPRQAPALHGASIEQFASTFRNASPDNPTVAALFKRFQRPNGVADMLEVFAGMCVICDGTTSEKVDFLFHLFDFAGKGNIVEDEATLMLECVAGAFTTIGLIVMPMERDLEFASGWIYTDRNTGETRGSANVEDFRKWVKNSPAAGEILEMLNCVPVVEELLSRFHKTVTEFVQEVSGGIEEELDYLGGDAGFGVLSNVKFRDDVRILVGPIIGTVTSTTVVILLEVDKDCDVNILLCLAGGYDESSVTLLPPAPESLGSGPGRAGGPRERLVRVQPLPLVACRPRSVQIQGLTPNAMYRIHVAGVAPDDSATRIGSFRTLSRGSGIGVSRLLQHRFFRNRYHMQPVEDRDTYGGVATGPTEDGLTLVALSGCSNREMQSSEKGSDGGEGGEEEEEYPSSNSNRNDISRNGDRATSAGVNETSLWKILWETTIRPSRCDLIVHAGGQVSVTSAVKNAVVLFNRYSRQDDEGETVAVTGGRGGGAGSGFEEVSTIQTNNKIRGKRAQQAKLEREAKEEQKRLELIIDRERKIAEDDDDHMNQLNREHPFHPHLPPPPTTPRTILNDKGEEVDFDDHFKSNLVDVLSNENGEEQIAAEEGKRRRSRTSSFGGMDFSGLNDGITTLLKSEKDLKKRVQFRKALFKGVETKETMSIVREHAMELIRDSYRRSFNLLYTRECLAHCSNMMCLGEEEINIGEDGKASAESIVLLKMCRRAYWEYQRQLWDVDCIKRSDDFQRRKERREYRMRKRSASMVDKDENKEKEEKIELRKKEGKVDGKSEEREIVVSLNNDEEEENKVIELRTWEIPLITEKKKRVLHEGRYVRAGNIGMLYVDAVGPRLSRQLDGSYNNKNIDNCDPIGEAQFQFISDQLNQSKMKHEGGEYGEGENNSIKCLVVVLHTPLTGRRHEKGSSSDSSRDVFANPSGQSSICRLIDMLFQWMSGKRRIVRVISGDNGVGPACEGELLDRLANRVRIQWISVGPMSARVLGAPPHDDPRSIEWQMRYGRNKKTSKRSKVEYPLTIKGRTLLSTDQGEQQPSWMPDIVWGAKPLWERRNYAVVRVFQGNESKDPGVKRPDGDPSLSKWFMHPDECRVETAIIPSHVAKNPSITLGPIIGTVTDTSAVIMIEIDHDAVVVCICRDILSNQERIATLCTSTTTTIVTSGIGGRDGLSGKVVRGNRPHVFLAEHLAPGRKYSVYFRGISNDSTNRRGSFVTLPKSTNQGSHVRLLVASTDHPHLLSNLQVNGYELINGGIASHHRDVMLPPKSTWESVWRDQLLGRWSGASSMLRLGGQVWLRGMVETQLSSVLESYRGDVFENILHLLYQVRQTATLPLTTKNLDGDVKSAPINIGDSSSGIVALQRGPAWTSSNLSVGAIPAGQERNEDAFETDEDGTTGNSNVPGLGINVGAAWSKYDQLCETIAETFRKVYRDAWNVPYLRQVLANCPQTMIPGGSDLACGFDVWKNSHEQRVFGPVVMGIALDVQIEYQHQLNEPYVLCSTGNTITGKKRQANHRATSTRMGTVQNVLLLTLDLWSNRISTGGSDGGHDDTSAKKRGRHVRGKLFEPDKPLLSDQQWKFLEDELKSLEKEDDEHKRKIKMEKEQSKSNNSGTGIRGTMVEMGEEEEDEEIPSTPVGIVDTIIIASDLPFTGRTPAEVDQLERSRPPSWSKDDWSCREQEYVRLLSMMFKWKGRSRDCRDVWFVCGGSSLTPAGECYITDVSTGMRLRQVTVGPATGLPTGALPEREIHFGKGGYTRTPVSRTFFRNYGVVHVRPPASLLVGRPGSSQSGRPSTRGSAWTSSSSRNKNVIKSRTRISLVTQSNFSRGDAHPLPPAEMTPRWWIAKTGSHPYADSVGRSRPGTTGTGPGSSIVPSGPPLLADRRSMMETVQEMEKEDEGKRKMEKDNQLQVMEAVNDYSRRGDRGKDIGGLGGGLDGGFMGLEALGLDTSGLIMDGGGRGTFYEEIRKRNVVENASVLVSWARDQMKKCLQDDATTQAAIEYVYRRYYLQVERLSDSVFYEDIAERIYGMMPVLGNNFDEMSNDYNNNNEDTYNDILSDLQLKINEMKSFEPGIREERMIVQLKHDAIVSTYQTNYDSKLRIERKKREIYYHVEGRLGDCQTAIVTATTRAGYPKRKGGQTALRVELHERKIEIDRRADRRERNRIKFEAKKGEVLTCKKESDFIMEMEIEEIKEEKRLSPVHVDDAARSKIAQAVIAMATFVQSAGIPKKKRKKMSKELANEAKTIMREQNVVRLQRNEVMLVNITDETPDAIALLQQFYQERVDLLQEEENEKLRDHRAKMSWLKERIDLLTEIDEQVTELEAECVVLREELEIRKEELRIATENRMQAQLELKDKKNDRRVALQVFDKQLSTLEEQLALGDVTSFVGRVESAVLYLWNEEPTGRALPKSIKKILPDLGNGFVLAHCLDNAFFTEIGGGDRGRSRPPMDPNAFYRCITEVVLQGAVLKAALTLPSE